MRRYYRYYLRTVLLVLSLFCYEGAGAVLADRYDEQHPLVIVCDWDMPPGEFLDENGQPAGYIVDLMNAIFKQLGIYHVFEMRESFVARDIFRKHDADVIVAPVDVLKLLGGRISTSVISRYHYKVLMRSNEPEIKSLRDIKPSQTVVLRKGEDFSMTLLEPSNLNIDQQPPMEAIVCVATGRYDFFVWGE
jgi:ABC-type amino acid transport substrate-binding protein